MRVQYQQWTDKFCRIILVHEHGTAQIELHKHPVTSYNVTALFCSLWVDEEHRRQGVATKLLEYAENLARKDGHKEMYLEWQRKSTGPEILQWYERRGYRVVAFGDEGCLMKKNLIKNA